MKKIFFLLHVILNLPGVILANSAYSQLFYNLINHKSFIVEQSVQSGRGLNLTSLAQQDPHLFTRLLKEVSAYPCLFITDKEVNEDAVEILFPGVSDYLFTRGKDRDTVKRDIEDFLAKQSSYAIILSEVHLHADHKRELLKVFPGVGIIEVSDILSTFTGSAGVGLNKEKIARLMKRKIKVLCTAAIIPIKEEERKQQYSKALHRVIEFGYRPYIVESCVSGPSYFDGMSSTVFYSLSNNPALRNKGVNEFVSMIKAFQHWDFDDEDMIIKLTGRYYFMSDSFIRFIEDAEDVDAAAKFVTVPAGPTKGVDAVLTGCFAMKCGEFKKMLNHFDYDWLEREMICVEHVVGPYLNVLAQKGFRVSRRDRLDLEANMFYTHGSSEISYW